MKQEKLQIFIRLLQGPHRHPYLPLYDLGLIVKEPESKIAPEKAFKELQKIVDIEKIVYDQFSFDEETVEKIIEAFRNKKWVFLEIKRDVGDLLLNQLKHLSSSNSIQLFDFKGKDVFEMKMPKESRLIIFSKRDFIENKISYPHFYRLFGPILSIK